MLLLAVFKLKNNSKKCSLNVNITIKLRLILQKDIYSINSLKNIVH